MLTWPDLIFGPINLWSMPPISINAETITMKTQDAPRVTSEEIEEGIAMGYYFTAAQGVNRAYNASEEDFNTLL